MTQFFGLYALTGKATSFVAPLTVGIVTGLAGSQRIGISVLVLFFAGGLLLMRSVKGRRWLVERSRANSDNRQAPGSGRWPSSLDRGGLTSGQRHKSNSWTTVLMSVSKG